jgi:hypothetical protein
LARWLPKGRLAANSFRGWMTDVLSRRCGMVAVTEGCDFQNYLLTAVQNGGAGRPNLVALGN